MQKRNLVLVLTLLVFATPLIADQTCKPVEGHFEAVVVPPGDDFCPPDPSAFCTAGRVWGGIQGNYQFVMSSLIPSGAVPTVFFFTGKSTIFLKSDDQVFGTDTGSIDLFGLGGFASLITFDGGTGEMSTAKGQIRLRGQLSATGTAGDYLGTLCTQ
jgi:hypothetical protein